MEMRYFLVLGCFLLSRVDLSAQTEGNRFMPADDGSAISFTIRNLGFNTGGSFKGLKGEIFFDPQNPAADSFNVSIDAATVNTGNNMRDDHLRADSYFDVQQYPRITFRSTSVSAADRHGRYTVTGNLTIKGITRTIRFPFLATPLGNDYIFKGSFTINRKDYGVGGTSTLSNQVTISLTVLAKAG